MLPLNPAPRLWTYVATAIAAAALAAAGTWRVQEWRHGAIDAKRLAAAAAERDAQDREAESQREYNQVRAGMHAAALAGLNTQLGDARAHIATLSTTRRCLGAGTVGLLNGIGKPPGLALRATAGQPAGAAQAAAGSAADDAAAGYASESDTAGHIATCRAWYGEVESQLNKIIDIEERRQGRAAQ